MQELEQLRDLVFNKGFDSESYESVLQYEKRLREVSAKEKIQQHQPIQEWIKYLSDTVSNARLLLATDRSLTDRQRDELFAKIDISNHLLTLLGTGEREQIESDIKKALNVAKAQVNP